MTEFARTIFLAVVFAMALAAVSAAGQQTPAPRPLPKPAPTVPVVPGIAVWTPTPVGRYERAIATDPNVTVSLCVLRGNLTVNSWNRSELRVFVKSGNKFDFTVKEKNARTGQPAWVSIGAAGPGRITPTAGECLSADAIDIDVPKGTIFNVKGRQVTLSVDSVRKVNVSTVGGGTQLRNISGGISALVNEGNVSVEDSSGAISLETTTGNIIVYESAPGEVGDTFRAKTNSGNIALQRIDHRQVEVNSISGSVAYSGAILDGGAYRFATQNGTLRMSVPAETSCRLTATYGGAFSVDLPMTLETENVTEGPIKTIVAKLGNGGDAVVNLTTSNGNVLIRKLPTEQDLLKEKEKLKVKVKAPAPPKP